MSYLLKPIIMRDGCGEFFSADDVCLPSLDGKTRTRAPKARSAAREAGWLVGINHDRLPEWARQKIDRKRGKFDLCPDCRR